MSFLDNLFNSAKRAIFKKDIDRLTESYQHLLGVLEVFPRTAVTEEREEKLLESVSRFGEWDTQLADLIVRRMSSQDVRKIELDDKTRMMVVEESRRLYVWDVITQYIIELWTDYGFGQKPDIIPDSDALKEVWNGFWGSQENQYIFNERRLNELSNKLQIDGEYWFVQFISKIDGESIMRIIETDDIRKTYYEIGDPSAPIYYKREWWTGEYKSEHHILYYRDYRATDQQAIAMREIILEEDKDAEFAEEKNEETDVLTFHLKFRDINGHGWPFLTSGFAWSRGYRSFLEDRATINRAAAAVVEKVKVQGGQRMVDAVKQRLQSSLANNSSRVETNPPPSTGSIWVENQALDREWMSRPTNAADAEKDGVAILSQVALAGKIYPHYLGRGEYYRLATATAMESPTYRSFNRYQTFWNSVWRTLVEMVALAKEKYGGMKFDTYKAEVNTDRIIDVSTKEIDEIMLAVSDAVVKGALSPDVATRTQESLIKTAIQSLGIPHVDNIVSVDTEELEESIGTGGYTMYQRAIRSATYGLWGGQLDRDSFINMMYDIIDIGLHKAWRDAMQEFGLAYSERTMDEEIALGEIIGEQWSHISGFADWIESNNKESGHLLRNTEYRQEMWANAYKKAYNKALQMAQSDPKLKWILGSGEHCSDCLKYSEKVKRASYWRQIGAAPQSSALACKGINCDCRLEITDEPLSRGYLTPPSG